MRDPSPVFGRRAPRLADTPLHRPQRITTSPGHDSTAGASAPPALGADAAADHRAILEAMRAACDAEAAEAPPAVPRTRRIAQTATALGIVIAFGLFLVWPLFPWWVYVAVSLLAMGGAYQGLLTAAAQETIVDGGTPGRRR